MILDGLLTFTGTSNGAAGGITSGHRPTPPRPALRLRRTSLTSASLLAFRRRPMVAALVISALAMTPR